MTDFNNTFFLYSKTFIHWINTMTNQSNKRAYYAAIYNSYQGQQDCNDIALMLTMGGEMA
jgi:hypothetical protein